MVEAGRFLIDQSDQFASEVMSLLRRRPPLQEHDLQCKISQTYSAFVQRTLQKRQDTLSPPESVNEGPSDLQLKTEKTDATPQTWWQPSPDTSISECSSVLDRLGPWPDECLSLQDSLVGGDDRLDWDLPDAKVGKYYSDSPGISFDHLAWPWPVIPSGPYEADLAWLQCTPMTRIVLDDDR